ncbi:MAG: AAA family ATPase, partial [Acutalibacteraceae bacterium]
MDSIVRARSAAQPIKTVVVNLFAGPGAGKSTCAWEIASKLKKQGYVAEYVSEYAKDLVWDERFDLLDGSLEHQTMIYNEQKHRQDRLMGKVDFIVTDSPTILNTQYLKESAPEFVKDCIAEYKSHNNFSIFIQRAKAYEQVGRIQTEEQARQLDDKIRDMLKINDIYFGTYKHETVDLSIENMIKTYERTNNTINEKKLDAEPDSNVEPPDPSITISDMQEYGYTWDGMLPLKEEAALHLYEEEDMQIFLLHADGSESIPDSAEDIIAHAEKGGVFGVHKEDWNALTKYRAMKEELAESAEDIIAHIDQAAAIFQPADMSATNKGARSDQPTPFYDIEAIKAVPIADVCEALGFQPQAKGGRMWCAVRDERTPSCCLYIDSNTFCDFGCGNIGGSNIDLVRYVLNCDSTQAIRQIAEMFGIDPVNNVQRAPTNSLTDSEWARIGIDGCLATKNFDFNIEKYGV